MKHADAFALLHDYVDGELSPAKVAEIEAHLDSCEECRREVAALRALASEARELRADIPPAHDLWPAIAERIGNIAANEIEHDPAAAAHEGNAITRFLRLVLSVRVLAPIGAAAATILIVAVIVSHMPHRAVPGPGAQPASLATSSVAAPSDSSANPFSGDFAPLPATDDPAAIAVLTALEQEVRQNDHDLALLESAQRASKGGGIFDVLADNFAIVNQAISEARAAWAANPECPQLVRLLTAAYRAKAALQGEAIRIAARA